MRDDRYRRTRPKDKGGQRDKKRKVGVSEGDQDEEEEVCESSP